MKQGRSLPELAHNKLALLEGSSRSISDSSVGDVVEAAWVRAHRLALYPRSGEEG